MTNRITERVSTLVSSQLPEFIRADYALFVTFLEKYYKFLEQDQNAQEVIQNARQYNDIDQTIDGLIDTFLKNYGPDLPAAIVANKKIVIKYLRDYFKSKGNTGSFEYLFKILYNANVNVTNPYERVLKTSDATWLENHVMKIYQVNQNPFDFKSTTIRGVSSGATAIVNNAVRYYENGLDVYELTLDKSSINGTFITDELVFGSKIIIKTTVPDQNLTKTFTGNNKSFVSLLYTTYFKREADSAGLDYWTSLLDGKLVTRRNVEYDTFVVGESAAPLGRVFSIVTNINVLDGGFGYEVGDDVSVNDKGYIAKGVVTKVKDTGDLNRKGAVREVKLVDFKAKPNTLFVPSFLSPNSFSLPNDLYIPAYGNTLLSVNVKSSPYNATGDGVTDDTSAIQSALNAAGVVAAAGGHKSVFFPANTYIVSDALIVPSNVIVFGTGSTSIIKKKNNPISNRTFILNANANIVVSDIFIEGNDLNANLGIGSGFGILSYYANNNTFKDITIANVWGIGIGVTESRKNYLQNIYVTNSGNICPGYWFNSDDRTFRSDHTVVNCVSNFNEGDGIGIATSNITILGGYYHDNGTEFGEYYTISGALGCAGIYGEYTSGISNITIRYASFFNNSESGVDLRANNLNISHCRTFNNGLTGFRIESHSNNVSIANCIIYNNGANTDPYAMSVNKEYWCRSGIGFDGTSNLSILDNIIGDTRAGNLRTQQYGIQFMNSRDDPGASTNVTPSSNVIVVARNYIENNIIAVSNIDPSINTFANLNNVSYSFSATPTAFIHTPTVRIRGNYRTDSSNILYANLEFNHGLTSGDIVTLKFTGNSQSYLNGTEGSYAIITIPKKNEFTVQAAGPSSGAVVITSDSTTITADNTYYTADITFNDPEVTSGYLYLTYSRAANLTVNTGAIGKYFGHWKDISSLISDSTVLQGKDKGVSDNDPIKYQPFSYAIVSDLNMNIWKDTTKALVHPAGKQMFSEYTVEVSKETSKTISGSTKIANTNITLEIAIT